MSNKRGESSHRLHKNKNNELKELKDTTHKVLGHVLELTPLSSMKN